MPEAVLNLAGIDAQFARWRCSISSGILTVVQKGCDGYGDLHPRLGYPNCLITPHIAWANRESRQRLMDVAVENLRQFLSGTPIHNVAR